MSMVERSGEKHDCRQQTKHRQIFEGPFGAQPCDQGSEGLLFVTLALGA